MQLSFYVYSTSVELLHLRAWWEQVDSNINIIAYVGSLHFSTVLAHMVGTSGLEPPTSRLSGVCSNQLSYVPVMVSVTRITRAYRRLELTFRFTIENCNGGDERDRTADPLLARQVLSQLSYTPMWELMNNE